VYNEGFSGVDTTMIVGRLEKNIKKYQPNMVITMMGVNDGGLGGRYIKPNFNLIKSIDKLNPFKHDSTFETNREDNESTPLEVVEVGKLFRNGEYNKSKRILENYLLRDPENYNANLDLALINFHLKIFNESERLFKKAFLINPTHQYSGVIHTHLIYIYSTNKK